MRDDLVQQLAAQIAKSHRDADLLLVPWGNMSQRGRDLATDRERPAARAVLASGLVVPTSDVLKKINDWDHGHVLPPRFVRELRALTQQEAG